METMVLREPRISPTKKVLENALGKAYAAYEELMTVITAKGVDLTPQWHYYNDGKAWLCKVQYKKKTVFWLSVWDKHFRIAFYFTQKNCQGIQDLDIDANIKKNFAETIASGKFLPLAMNINKKSQLKDALVVIGYKKSLK